jgi:hypothetical protein
VAENVTHVTHEVTFERGRPTVRIPLQQHDSPVQTTMWIEDKEFARWTFSHHSVATTQAVNIDSAGDYLTSVITDFLIWIVSGGFLAGVMVKRALDRAGIGPQYGYAPWIAGITILTGLGAAVLYQSLADLVVNARPVLAGYVVAIFAVVLLETYTTNVSRALFIRPTLEHSESPTGEEAWDIIDMEIRSEKIVRGPDGSVSVVKPGLLPFLARVFGRKARLYNAEQLRTRLPVTGSKYDEMFVTDPEAEEILYYKPESWTLSFPPLDRGHAPTYGLVLTGLLVAGAALSQGAASGWAVGAVTVVGLAWWALEPTDGVAGVEPAPVHIRSAFGTMLRHAEDVDDAKRLDEVKRKLDAERIHKQRDVDREVADHDVTLMQEMFDPDGKVPASVEGEEDNEVTEKKRENANTWENGTAQGGDDD